MNHPIVLSLSIALVVLCAWAFIAARFPELVCALIGHARPELIARHLICPRCDLDVMQGRR